MWLGEFARPPLGYNSLMAVPGKWIEGVSPTSSVTEVAARSLQARLAAVQHPLPLAALLAHEDVEHVHRLRVATRRAAAAVKLYKHLLPRRKTAALKLMLRDIRRAAGAARDLDVLAMRLQAAHGNDLSFVRGEIARHRASAQSEIKSAYDAAMKGGALAQLTYSVVNRVRARRKRDRKPEYATFGPWARRRFVKPARQFFQSQPADLNDYAALHQFRIRGKALRYAMELLAPAFPNSFRKDLYPRVEELQDLLGAINDHVAGIAQLEKWQDLAGTDGERELLGKRADHERDQLQAATEKFAAWWTEERAAKLRRELIGEPVADESPDAPLKAVSTMCERVTSSEERGAHNEERGDGRRSLLDVAAQLRAEGDRQIDR